MTATTAPAPARAAEEVAGIVEDLFTTVDGWRRRLEAHLEAAEPTARTLDPVVEEFAVPAVT
ncbi:hypothetical protein FJ656_33310, partial [Schumannella luteola]